jgi:soluble lytic murein transglycosylase-like protein
MSARSAVVAGCLALAAPVQAQTATESSNPSPQEHNGYRLAETADGFQLVEHGVWEAPLVNAVRASAQGPSVFGSLGVEPRHEERARLSAGPNGFRRAAYLPHVYAAEAQFRLPKGLLDALIWTESRYNPFAVSKAGAAGLGQLMPGTAKELGVANRFDPLANLSGAAKYLRQMLDRFGVVHLALAAYNAGPGAVERANGIPRNGETPEYVRNVLARWRP